MIVTRYINGEKIEGPMPKMEITNPEVVRIIAKLQNGHYENIDQRNKQNMEKITS